MKGGGGLRRTWRRSIEATEKARRSISRLACSARSWLSRSNLSSLRPSRWVRRAFNVCFLAVPNSTSTVQYSRLLKTSISELALADQAQRHRLHAAGRAAARQLAPQHGREGEAHEIIERAARHIGVDQRLVEFARMGDGVKHRLLGDGVEGDALHVDPVERLPGLEHVPHVPGNRLALAVRVGGEVELAALGHRLGDGVEPLLGLGIDQPVHGEILVRAD